MARKPIWLIIAAIVLTPLSAAQKEPKTALDKLGKQQKLTLPKDPPMVSVGTASQLIFNVSPLSGTGLLSEQTRDALKAILKLNGGAQIIHIRAFSAGSGDIRRIPQIVSDVLGSKSAQLPSVSVLQVGALPVDDAQVVLETVSMGKKDVNKAGVAFHPVEGVVATDPQTSMKELLEKSLSQLAAKMNGRPALAVTCFVSSFENAGEFPGMIKARFPGAVIDLVQSRRLAWETGAGCEGVSQGGASQGGSAGSQRLAFTGTQVAFGATEKDAETAVQRLDRALTEAGAARGTASVVRLYLPSPAAAAIAMKQLQGAMLPAAYSVEAVGPESAAFAIDVVAAIQ